MHIVYLLHSVKINRFYIGYTSNLELRIEFHEHADSRKYTYNADDWVLFFSINCDSKSQALSVEKHIKAMKSKVYIENLKKYPEMVDKLLKKYNLSDC